MFDLALLKKLKTCIMQNQQHFINGAGSSQRQYLSSKGRSCTGSPVTRRVLSYDNIFIESIE